MRNDPYRSFRFVVEVQGLVVAGFSSIGGLERATTLEDYREGGRNDFVHKLVTLTKYPNLVLKRGLANGTDLWDWHQKVIDGNVERESISVIVQDEKGQEAHRYVFEDAYPTKWNGSDLDASGNSVVVESVELAHHGMRRQG